MPRFPHLSGSTPYPRIDNIDVYKYENNFNYRRWTEGCEITLCNVPWCGDYDNVVKFEDDVARNAYFAKIEEEDPVTIATVMQMMPDGTIKLPVPVNKAVLYNYIHVHIPVMTSAGDPLDYASDAKTDYFYFVLDVVQGSPSATTFILAIDWWTTYVNDVDIDMMILERGHAPMSEMRADEFLTDPLTNNELVCAEDRTFGEISNTSSVEVVNFSEDPYFVFLTYADVFGSWGSMSGDWQVPANVSSIPQGAPAPNAYAIDADNLASFLANVDASAPQLKRAVLCCFFISKSLVTSVSSGTFCGHTVQQLASSGATVDIAKLGKDLFSYPEQYGDIAKLYTYPYAEIVVSDGMGNDTHVHVQDIGGDALSAYMSVSLAYPYVSIASNLINVGGVSREMTWRNGISHQYSYGGSWYDMLMSWDVPTFAIAQGNSTTNDYATHYDRTQAQVAYTNTYDSALASNSTALTNSNNNAANITANNAVTVAASNATTANTIASNSTGAGYTNTKLRTDVQYDIGNSNASFDAEMAQLGVAATNNDAQAAASAANTVLGTASGVMTSLATGNVLGAVGAAVGGIQGGISTGVNWQTANASITVSQSNNTAVYNQAVTSAYGKQDSSIEFTNNSTDLSNSTMSANNSVNNNASTSIASNNASLTRTNAQNNKNTADANAERSQNTAQQAINNQILQAGLGAPNVFGSASNSGMGVTRPMACFAVARTLNKSALRQTGDYFLRYGYAFNGQWTFTSYNLMRYFTYWKASDLWCVGGKNVIEAAQQEIKQIIMKGVTVWNDPDMIGKVSIYDNYRQHG